MMRNHSLHIQLPHDKKQMQEEEGESLSQLLSWSRSVYAHGVDVAFPSSSSPSGSSKPSSITCSPATSPVVSRRCGVAYDEATPTTSPCSSPRGCYESFSSFSTASPNNYSYPQTSSMSYEDYQPGPSSASFFTSFSDADDSTSAVWMPEPSLQSSFWEETRSAFENTNQNILSLLWKFLDREAERKQEEEEEEEDFVVTPKASSMVEDSCANVKKRKRGYEADHGDAKAAATFCFDDEQFKGIFDGLEVLFTQETIDIIPQEEQPMKKSKKEGEEMEEIDEGLKKKRRFTTAAEDEKMDDNGYFFEEIEAYGCTVQDNESGDLIYDEEIILEYLVEDPSEFLPIC